MDALLSGSGYVHDLDPVAFTLLGFPVWYYGLAYAVGFLGLYFWFLANRRRLGLGVSETLELSILWAGCVLLCGRLFDVVFYEWPYYREHLWQVLSVWRGGIASHGVLIGALVGAASFSLLRGRSFLRICDEAVIPAALFLALGRIANFINGMIHGYVTDLPWGVQFPEIEGFRHPVALYEALKNFALIPILFLVRATGPSVKGRLLAHFIFWYGFLRLFTDGFREYGVEWFGIGTGQYFNVGMSLVGLALMFWLPRHFAGLRADQVSPPAAPARPSAIWLRAALFAAILVVSLSIPGSWTHDARLWLD
jgi:phosphatidylglycerol:prolipoprotein diacylglycerol transferase